MRILWDQPLTFLLFVHIYKFIIFNSKLSDLALYKRLHKSMPVFNQWNFVFGKDNPEFISHIFKLTVYFWLSSGFLSCWLGRYSSWNLNNLKIKHIIISSMIHYLNYLSLHWLKLVHYSGHMVHYRNDKLRWVTPPKIDTCQAGG